MPSQIPTAKPSASPSLNPSGTPSLSPSLSLEPTPESRFPTSLPSISNEPSIVSSSSPSKDAWQEFQSSIGLALTGVELPFTTNAENNLEEELMKFANSALNSSAKGVSVLEMDLLNNLRNLKVISKEESADSRDERSTKLEFELMGRYNAGNQDFGTEEIAVIAVRDVFENNDEELMSVIKNIPSFEGVSDVQTFDISLNDDILYYDNDDVNVITEIADSSDDDDNTEVIIIGSVAGVLFLMNAFFIALFLKRRSKTKSEEKLHEEIVADENDVPSFAAGYSIDDTGMERKEEEALIENEEKKVPESQ